MLKDSFGRIHNYLRISLTEKCNLRCTYCNPVDLPKGHYTNAVRMTADEIESIASVFIEMGVKKIRLTGGEPLVRKDAATIIQRLSGYPVELAITTNGVYVHEYIHCFKQAGISAVNVSLDTLSKEKNLLITGRNEFDNVIRNINRLLDEGFHVKINMVVMKGVNESEIPDFIEWTKRQPVHVRFIEYMPFAGNHWKSTKVFSCQEILDLISTKYDYKKLSGEISDTAKKFSMPGHPGTFAVISTMSLPFCDGCNRLRLTADGKMKNCLFSNTEVDLLTSLRQGQDITHLIKQCVADKKEKLGGQFNSVFTEMDNSGILNRSMINIGG